jgi:hypothetical protein
MAEHECQYCHKPIGYERRFYFLPSEQGTTSQGSTRGELVHAACHEDAIATEQQKGRLEEALRREAIHADN